MAANSTAPKGLNLDDVREGLEMLLPLARLIARRTRTKVDDAAVEFLERLLARPADMRAAMAASGLGE